MFYIQTKNKQKEILNKYTKIEFKYSDIKVIKISKIQSGFLKKEISIKAVYGLEKNININSLKSQLINLGYKQLPIDRKDGIIEDNFSEYLNNEDKGFYKINVNHKEGIQEWIIINLSKMKIILEANL